MGSGTHRYINSSRLNPAVAQNVSWVGQVLLHSDERPSEQVPQAVRKNLSTVHARLPA